MITREILIHAVSLCLFLAAVIACFMPKINSTGRRK